MFGETTGSILRLPRFLVAPVRAGAVRISTRQLDTVLNQVERATLKAKRLVAGKSVIELTTSLEPTSWSVAQCFDHLAQTTNVFSPLYIGRHRACPPPDHKSCVADRHAHTAVHTEPGATIPATVQSADAVGSASV